MELGTVHIDENGNPDIQWIPCVRVNYAAKFDRLRIAEWI
jgi:hypothetical protein